MSLRGLDPGRGTGVDVGKVGPGLGQKRRFRGGQVKAGEAMVFIVHVLW